MHTTSWPPDLKRMLLSRAWPDVQLAPAMLCHATHMNQSQEPTALARTSPMHLERDSKPWRWRNQWHWSPVLQILSSQWFAFKIMTYRENFLAAVNHRWTFSVYYCSALSPLLVDDYSCKSDLLWLLFTLVYSFIKKSIFSLSHVNCILFLLYSLSFKMLNEFHQFSGRIQPINGWLFYYLLFHFILKICLGSCCQHYFKNLISWYCHQHWHIILSILCNIIMRNSKTWKLCVFATFQPANVNCMLLSS